LRGLFLKSDYWPATLIEPECEIDRFLLRIGGTIPPDRETP
jgi:hypothetical protein